MSEDRNSDRNSWRQEFLRDRTAQERLRKNYTSLNLIYRASVAHIMKRCCQKGVGD